MRRNFRGHLHFGILFLIFVTLSYGQDFKKAVLDIPSKNIKSYSFDPGKPLISRVSNIPEFLLDYMKKYDERKDYTAYKPSEKEMSMIGEYLRLLPPVHKKVMKERLVGIYFINNFLGSGFTDYILSENNKIHTVLILNPSVLRSDLTNWLTYRENTCFISNPEHRIEVNCGKEYTGLMYILLHETTHIVDYILLFTPFVEPDMIKLGNYKKEKTALIEGIWDDYSLPAKSHDYSYRGNLTFYGIGGGPKINISDAESVYKQLFNSPFISLYGSMSWAEDFAELVTFYHLTAKLKQPCMIKFYKGQELLYNLDPSQSPNVQKRIKSLQSLYKLSGE
ncbi:hypothetical protein ACFL4T_06625 [candidate division KSB1 bacterium]